MATPLNISIRTDAGFEGWADALFAELGMNLSTAFNIFVRQSFREGGIPFEVKAGTAQQGNDWSPCWKRKGLQKDLSVKGSQCLDELFADLKK